MAHINQKSVLAGRSRPANSKSAIQHMLVPPAGFTKFLKTVDSQ